MRMSRGDGAKGLRFSMNITVFSLTHLSEPEVTVAVVVVVDID